MKHLILIRHGQSEWNQQKRFTGWVDVGLTDKGRAEAKKAGELIKEKKIKLDSFYSSYQKRANDTLKIVMKELNEDENLITKKWQLNERHYGELTGLNKEDMKKKYGEEKIHQFRRSWDVKPGALDRKSPYHPLNIKTYKDIREPINYINKNDKPLGLYYFGNNKNEEAKVINSTSSGGVTVNDIMGHIQQNELGFGGVGPSGMGKYDGFDGFMNFSNNKPIYKQIGFGLDKLLDAIRPPYKGSIEDVLKKLLK